MKKLWTWFLASHRWQHLLGGIVIGLLSDGWYCAALAGCGTAGALEFKDYKYKQGWDWVDFAITLAGVALGYTIRNMRHIINI